MLLLQPFEPALKGTYTESKACERCHREIYRQWEDSPMARAFTDPLFQDQLKESKEKAECLTCHAPMKDLVPGGEKEGIGCDLCHSVRSVEVEERGAKALLDRGIMSRSWPSLPHGRDASVSRTPELCAICHHYGKGAMIEDTYISWRGSPYAAKGIRCQDCHMPLVGGKRSHAFEGGHQKGMVERALGLDFLLLKDPDGLDLYVIVTNRGAGHKTPGGTMGRQLWLVVEGYRGKGKVFEERRLYGKVFDGEGRVVDTALKPGERRKEVFHLPPAGKIRISLLYYLAPVEVQKAFGWELTPLVVKDLEVLP